MCVYSISLTLINPSTNIHDHEQQMTRTIFDNSYMKCIVFIGGGQKKGKSKKWKNYLQFPHYTDCLHIRNEVDTASYDYVVDKQPIGKRLFRLFCANHPQYDRCCELLTRVVSDDIYGIIIFFSLL